MLDLDHFKAINDTWGHATGDEVLRRAASLLRDTLASPPNLLARYGGEEFAIVLPDTTLSEALKRAEALRATLAAHPLAVETKQVRVTLSIGVALSSADDGSLETALARADAALYRAKADGRNRVALAEDIGGPAPPSISAL